MNKVKKLERRSIVCNKNNFLKKRKKNHEKNMKKKKKPKVSLIPSHINHTFFILDPQIGPQTFKHSHSTIGKNGFSNVKKGPIQGSIWFKLVPELLFLGPLFKVALKMNFVLSAPRFFYFDYIVKPPQYTPIHLMAFQK
jgi:hypothetical protein